MHEAGTSLIYYPSQIWQHVLQNVKSAKTYFDEKANKYSFSHILKRLIETQHSYKLATMIRVQGHQVSLRSYKCLK